MKCSQEDCGATVVCSYLWPGAEDRLYACEKHARQAAGLAKFMGLQLELVRVEEDELSRKES